MSNSVSDMSLQDRAEQYVSGRVKELERRAALLQAELKSERQRALRARIILALVRAGPPPNIRLEHINGRLEIIRGPPILPLFTYQGFWSAV